MMTRRTLLAAALAPQSTGIVDTHIHLFDPTRPQGVPWPAKDHPAYRATLPSRLREVAGPLGITRAIHVECSPWIADNDWVLGVAARDRVMAGVIGNLDPAVPDFAAQLDRLRKNRLFLGIRYGYLWNRDLRASLANPAFLDGVRRLAAAGLTLDTANPSRQLLDDVLRLTDRVPDLRVVIDHLAALPVTGMEDFRPRKQIYAKLSGGLRAPDLSARLDHLRDVFGPDRVLYASDWPNSDRLGSYAEVFGVLRDHYAVRPPDEREKFFSRNSAAAYRYA